MVLSLNVTNVPPPPVPALLFSYPEVADLIVAPICPTSIFRISPLFNMNVPDTILPRPPV